MIVIRLFTPLSFMLQLATVAPEMLMPLSFMLQVQIWMQLTMLMLLLDMIFLEI